MFILSRQAIMVAYLSMEIGYHDGADLDMAIDHFILVACGTLTITKILLIRLHRDNLSKYMYNAASDWMYVAQQDHHREIMLRYANLGRFVFFFQMCSSYIVLTPLILEPLLSFVTVASLQNVTLSVNVLEQTRAVKLPQEMICPFDAELVCFGICIVQIVQLIGTATGNVGSDVFLFGVCMHLCGQLEVLGLELLGFHEGKGGDYWSRSKMVALVERHCLLLNLARDIVDTLDVILIVQLIFHATLICLIGIDQSTDSFSLRLSLLDNGIERFG